jgi:hypothetical protein
MRALIISDNPFLDSESGKPLRLLQAKGVRWGLLPRKSG